MQIAFIDPHSSLPAKVFLPRACQEGPLRRHSPALGAMTDFSVESPVCVTPRRHIDDALQDMIHAGIRSLLIVDASAVLGLITAADILGTRPIQFLQSPLCEGQPCRHQDVHVADIMTPWDELRLVDIRLIAAITAGDLADQFRSLDTTHILAIERAADGSSSVRGLFSKTRLLRQLGVGSAAE